MSFVHNLAGVPSIKDAYAIISVTYPEGSTCTCTLGTKTLTATDTSGEYIFRVPEAGTWTVRAYDGATWESSDNKIGKAISIDTQFQVISQLLDYSPHLTVGDFSLVNKRYDSTGDNGGNLQIQVANNRFYNPNRFFTCSGGATYGPINLSAFDTMHVVDGIYGFDSGTSYAIAICSIIIQNGNPATKAYLITDGVVITSVSNIPGSHRDIPSELDISNINFTNGYITIGIRNSGNAEAAPGYLGFSDLYFS